jgi:UDP-glucose 4-epimerase
VIPAFVRRALAGEPLVLAGDGLQSRRFVYVEDLADGVVRALAPAAANRVYNLVGDTDVTIREIADTVRDLVGDTRIVHGPGRSGDFAGAPVSGERAAAELGWRPVTPFREGVRRCVEFQQQADAGASPARVPRIAVAPGARRALIALAVVIASAALGVGLATLAPPLDPDRDKYDIFATLLLLQLPFLLARGFAWESSSARRLRIVLWAIATLALAVVVLPWPGALDRFGSAHVLFLALMALSAAGAAAFSARVR